MKCMLKFVTSLSLLALSRFPAVLALSLVGCSSPRVPIAGDQGLARAEAKAWHNERAAIASGEASFEFLRELRSFLETDALDPVEFERRFRVVLQCQPWKRSGRICTFVSEQSRWPYASYQPPEPLVSFNLYGDGSPETLSLALMFSSDQRAATCLTGEMFQQVFASPRWKSTVELARSDGGASQAVIQSLIATDDFGRQVRVVTQPSKACAGLTQVIVRTGQR